MEARLKSDLDMTLYQGLFPRVRTTDIPVSGVADALGVLGQRTALAAVPLRRVLVGTFEDVREACADLLKAWRTAVEDTWWGHVETVVMVRGGNCRGRGSMLGLVCEHVSDLVRYGARPVYVDILDEDETYPRRCADELASHVAYVGLTANIPEAAAWRRSLGIEDQLRASMWRVWPTQYTDEGAVHLGLTTTTPKLLLRTTSGGGIVCRSWHDEVEKLLSRAISTVQMVHGYGQADINLIRGKACQVDVSLDVAWVERLTLDELPHELCQAHDDPVAMHWAQDRLKAGELTDDDLGQVRGRRTPRKPRKRPSAHKEK